MSAAQLILFEAVRARRFCGKIGLRLKKGCLEKFSHHGRHRFQMHVGLFSSNAVMSDANGPAHLTEKFRFATVMRRSDSSPLRLPLIPFDIAFPAC